MNLKFYIALLLGLTSLPAQAYLGPGMGAGAFGVFIGIVASLFIAIFAIVWFPLKRFLKARKQQKLDQKQAEAQSLDTEPSEQVQQQDKASS